MFFGLSKNKKKQNIAKQVNTAANHIYVGIRYKYMYV